jgi:hypothetical protein
VSRAVLDPCCCAGLGTLLVQINVICLLLAVIGIAAIVRHHAWLDGVTAVLQTTIGR